METKKINEFRISTNYPVLTILLFIFSLGCSKDSATDPVSKGNFTYTVSGAASKTVAGDNAKFGSIAGGALLDQTYISLIAGADELDIRIVIDPTVIGTYLVNPKVIEDNGQIVIQDVVERDSWADLGMGSTLTNDRRGFSTNSANGGSVTIVKVEGSTIEGNFNMSLMELLGGDDVFNNPKITVQGSFTATKQ